MTETSLKKIEERAEKATEGPWSTPLNLVWRKINNQFEDVSIEDEDFIAHAREDVPELVAEVRRLRIELARSFAFAAEAKIKFAPNTTNSIVDEWLQQVNGALGDK